MVGCDERHERDAVRVARGEDRLGLLEREVGDDQPADPALRQLGGEALGPARDRSGWRNTSARPGRSSAIRAPASRTACTVAPASSAFVAAAWITGPSASGSLNGTPSSIRSAPDSA